MSLDKKSPPMVLAYSHFERYLEFLHHTNLIIWLLQKLLARKSKTT